MQQKKKKNKQMPASNSRLMTKSTNEGNYTIIQNYEYIFEGKSRRI